MRRRSRLVALASATAMALAALVAPAAHAGGRHHDDTTTQWVTWEIPAPGCPKFEADGETSSWSSPYATDFVNSNEYGSTACNDNPATTMWPQDLAGTGTHDEVDGLKECTWYQVDKMVGSRKQIDDVLEDSQLTHGEDWGLTKKWYFHYTGGDNCGTSTEEPPAEPTDVELDLTYVPACAPDPTNSWIVTNASDLEVPFTLYYKVNDEWQEQESGTVSAGSQVEISTDRADVLAKLRWGGTDAIARGKVKVHAGDDLNGDDCITTVPVPAPTWEEGCLANDGQWIYDEDAVGINWALTAVLDGAYTIDALPKDGYAFTEDAVTSWTEYDTQRDCVLTPPAPTFTDPCGADNVTVDTAFYPGVAWDTVVNGATVTATATPAEGYAFNAGAETEWSFTDSGEECEAPNEPEPTDPNDEPVATLDGTIVGNLCLGDVPYLTYDVTVDDPAGLVDDSALPTITFLPDADEQFYSDGVTPIEPITISLPSMSGELLWPGAELDSEGTPAGWPGWALVDGEWSDVGLDNWGWTRDGQALISVNPDITVQADYPEATSDCAEPPAPASDVADEPVVTASRVLSAGPTVVTGEAPAATPVVAEVTYTG